MMDLKSKKSRRRVKKGFMKVKIRPIFMSKSIKMNRFMFMRKVNNTRRKLMTMRRLQYDDMFN